MSTVKNVLQQRKWRPLLFSTIVLIEKYCLAVVFLQVNLFVALERNSVSIKIMSLGR